MFWLCGGEGGGVSPGPRFLSSFHLQWTLTVSQNAYGCRREPKPLFSWPRHVVFTRGSHQITARLSLLAALASRSRYRRDGPQHPARASPFTPPAPNTAFVDNSTDLGPVDPGECAVRSAGRAALGLCQLALRGGADTLGHR